MSPEWHAEYRAAIGTAPAGMTDETPRRPRRRGLLGAVVALVVAPAVVKGIPVIPDAELLNLCRQHTIVWALIDAMDAGAPHTDEDMDAATDQQSALNERITAICPTTMAGFAAKARAVQEAYQGYEDPDAKHNSPERIADTLLANLIAMGDAT